MCQDTLILIVTSDSGVTDEDAAVFRAFLPIKTCRCSGCRGGDCSPDVAMLSRLLAVLLFAACASGLKMMPPAPRSAAMCSRRAVPLVAAGVAFAQRAPAFAADKSAKEDKKFIACLSECVYTETKIAKGLAEVEVLSRAEAYARCEQHAKSWR